MAKVEMLVINLLYQGQFAVLLKWLTLPIRASSIVLEGVLVTYQEPSQLDQPVNFLMLVWVISN